MNFIFIWLPCCSLALGLNRQFYIKGCKMDQLTNKNGVEKVQLLPAINDNYGGVEVELKERMDSDVFLARLKASMLEWTLQVLSHFISDT